MVFTITRLSDSDRSYNGSYVTKKPCEKAYTTDDEIELSERDLIGYIFRNNNPEWKEEDIEKELEDYDVTKERYSYGTWKIDLHSIQDLQDLMEEVGELIIDPSRIKIYDYYNE